MLRMRVHLWSDRSRNKRVYHVLLLDLSRLLTLFFITCFHANDQELIRVYGRYSSLCIVSELASESHTGVAWPRRVVL